MEILQSSKIVCFQSNIYEVCNQSNENLKISTLNQPIAHLLSFVSSIAHLESRGNNHYSKCVAFSFFRGVIGVTTFFLFTILNAVSKMRVG